MLRYLFFLSLISYNFFYSQNEYEKKIDSLSKLINQTKNDKLKLKYYSNICDIYKLYDVSKITASNKKLLYYSIITKNTNNYFKYYVNQALYYKNNTDIPNAIKNYKTATQLLHLKKDWDNYIFYSTEYAICLSTIQENNKAIQTLNNLLTNPNLKKNKNLLYAHYGLFCVYKNMSNYTQAIKNAKKILSNINQLKNKEKILTSIATLYLDLGKNEKALEYINLTPINNTNQNYQTKFIKANILFNQKKYNESLNILDEVCKYCLEKKIKGFYYDCLVVKTKCYINLNNFQLANKSIEKTIKNLTYKRNIDTIVTKSLKAKILLNLNEEKEAKKIIDETIVILDTTNTHFEQILETYEIKKAIEKKLGNYKTALLYNEKIQKIKDKNIIEHNTNKINQLEVEVELIDKNNNIKKLKIEQLKKQVEINSKNYYLTIISLILFIIIFTSIFFIKSNKIIKQKNIKIENEKKSLKQALQEKETLLKEIHHRVKNNMQLVLSLLQIQSQKENQEIKDFVNVSHSRILSMALIHENLYQSENLNQVNFKTYIDNLIQIIKNTYYTKNSKIDVTLKIDEILIDIHIAIPLGLIINELLSNSYKHAFPNNRDGLIQIELIQKKRNSQLIISDNGVGLKNKKNEKKTLGLQIVEELVFQIDGQMKTFDFNGLEYKIRFENTKLIPNNIYE